MAFITVADTGLISYVSTRNLAERWGFGPLSWLYPLCLDAVAAVGMDLWMSNSPAKRAAKYLALSAVALSLLANVVDWLYVCVGAAVLGAVPPLMLAALLLTLHRHTAHQRHGGAELGEHADVLVDIPGLPISSPAASSPNSQVFHEFVDCGGPQSGAVSPASTAPASDDDSAIAAVDDAASGAKSGAAAASPAVPVRPGGEAPVPVPAVPRRKGPKPPVADHVVIGKIREHERNNGPLTRDDAMATFRMGPHRTRRLLAQARISTPLDGAPLDGTSLDPADES